VLGPVRRRELVAALGADGVPGRDQGSALGALLGRGLADAACGTLPDLELVDRVAGTDYYAETSVGEFLPGSLLGAA
jgi:hypothetical protein